jgi:hypothetical protein
MSDGLECMQVKPLFIIERIGSLILTMHVADFLKS